MRLESDAVVQIGGQRSFEGCNNLDTVLNNEFDAGVMLCEFDVVVACGTTNLQLS